MTRPSVDILSYASQLKIHELDEVKYVFDPVRKKNIVLQPEELVRQLLVLWLNDVVGISFANMALERRIKMKQGYKRFDIVCYDKQAEPMILVECKAFDIALSSSTAMQIAQYNQYLKCPYLILSNGKKTLLYRISNEGEIQSIDSILL
jgi:hypothetical protein